MGDALSLTIPGITDAPVQRYPFADYDPAPFTFEVAGVQMDVDDDGNPLTHTTYRGRRYSVEPFEFKGIKCLRFRRDIEPVDVAYIKHITDMHGADFALEMFGNAVTEVSDGS